MRTLMAGVVNAETSPRPRARYSSWIDAGRAPACCPISQISQRARSRVPWSPNTASRTSWSMASERRTEGDAKRRRMSCDSSAIRKPPVSLNLGLAYVDDQTVVRRSDAGGQRSGQIRMRGLVSQVGEERPAGADRLRHRHRLRYREMQGVRPRQERRQHEHVEAPQAGPRRLRHVLHVGDVREAADPVRQHFLPAMRQRQGLDVEAGDANWDAGDERTCDELGLGCPRRRLRLEIEDVREFRAELRQSFAGAVGLEGRALLDGECAE